jgi:hypothetical protein
MDHGSWFTLRFGGWQARVRESSACKRSMRQLLQGCMQCAEGNSREGCPNSRVDEQGATVQCLKLETEINWKLAEANKVAPAQRYACADNEGFGKMMTIENL